MMFFQSRHHKALVLEALQNIPEVDIRIAGHSQERTSSDSLWMFSPLVRSIMDSVNNTEDLLMILPDFSCRDIKTALDLMTGNKREDLLVFNSTTRIILETLGVDLNNISDNTDDVVRDEQDETNDSKMIHSEKIKREVIEERLVTSDDISDDEEYDDEEDIQRLLLAQNPDLDSSDEEDETETADVTVGELTSGQNIKVERSEEITNNENNPSSVVQGTDNTNDDDDDDDIQKHLIKIMDQDLSDSDDDDSLVSPIQDDTPMDPAERVEEFLENQLIQDILMKDQEFSDDEEENNEGRNSSESKSMDEMSNVEDKNCPDERSDLHRQKLQEVEQLMIRENGIWRCKHCKKSFKKKDRLRRHAETHISGLSFACDHCSEYFKTRSKLAHHKFDNHSEEMKESRPSFEANPIKREMIHNEKLKEVETLLGQEGDLWKCKSCGKTFDRRSTLRNHVEIHVKGLSYQCKHCSKLCPNRVSLRNHLQNTHRADAKKLAKEANMASKGNTFFSENKEKVDRELKTNRTETVNKVSIDRELKTNRTETVNKVSNSGPIHNIENSPDRKSELHRQKLQEVEQLMIRGNGVWRCKHCDKTFKKKDTLRRHAENHVSGLSFSCDYCSEYFETRGRLYHHKFKEHNEIRKNTRQNFEANPAKRERIHNEKLRVVEQLLDKEMEMEM